jgi:L-lactate dehydrogenase complex protein LldF
MKVRSNDFIKSAKSALGDADMRSAVAYGTNAGFDKRQVAMYASGDQYGEALRGQAAAIKRKTLTQLPELLDQAETNLQENGFEVLWAVDANEVNQRVSEIVERHGLQLAVKSKSMVTEEVALNQTLEAQGVEVVETDLGEFIVQISDDAPSHIVIPVVHRTKESIRDDFVAKVGMPPTDDTQEMTHFARRHLRDKFLAADLGISGGNFIIAETGSLCLVENEGNARMVTSLPKVHIALVGIEKVVATLEDYATLTQVLPRSATGQTITVYTHMINGPRREDESDGPEHVYVIFVDNGRSRIYASDYAEALACIRCGACLNACPVYKITGGHAYGWVYPGPIGAVITPLLLGLEHARPLPNASSLCGLCKDVCPVDIDLPGMLLELRRDLVEQNHANWAWHQALKIWSRLWDNPARYRLSGKLGAWGSKLLPDKLPGVLGGWTKSRTMPKMAAKTFRQQWQEQQTEKGGQHG